MANITEMDDIELKSRHNFMSYVNLSLRMSKYKKNGEEEEEEDDDMIFSPEISPI